MIGDWSLGGTACQGVWGSGCNKSYVKSTRRNRLNVIDIRERLVTILLQPTLCNKVTFGGYLHLCVPPIWRNSPDTVPFDPASGRASCRCNPWEICAPCAGRGLPSWDFIERAISSTVHVPPIPLNLNNGSRSPAINRGGLMRIRRVHPLFTPCFWLNKRDAYPQVRACGKNGDRPLSPCRKLGKTRKLGRIWKMFDIETHGCDNRLRSRGVTTETH